MTPVLLLWTRILLQMTDSNPRPHTVIVFQHKLPLSQVANTLYRNTTNVSVPLISRVSLPALPRDCEWSCSVALHMLTHFGTSWSPIAHHSWCIAPLSFSARPLISAQHSRCVCTCALSGLSSPSSCLPCAHPMAHSQPQSRFRVLVIRRGRRANAGKTPILQRVRDITESPTTYWQVMGEYIKGT